MTGILTARPGRLASLALAAALLTVGSSPSAAADRPGVGPQTGMPVGEAFAWPAGLVIQEPVEGFDRSKCRRPDETDPDHTLGVGVYVRLCLSFINTTAHPIRVELPAGLTFVSFDDETQNGLLVIVESFEVPPGDQPVFVKLALQCLNHERGPSASWDTFRPGPVTTDSKLVALIESPAGRTFETEADILRLQNLVWNVTDDRELSPDERRWAASLRP